MPGVAGALAAWRNARRWRGEMRADGMALRVWGRGPLAVGRGRWGASRTEARDPASENVPDENAPALL